MNPESGISGEEHAVALVSPATITSSLALDPAWRRERVYWHRASLAAAVMVLLLSMTMSTSDGRRVMLPGMKAPLPETCMTKVAWGMPCPGCGMTRAFIALGHGRVGDAWAFNPAAFLIYPVVVFQLPWRWIQLRRLSAGKSELELPGVVPWLGLTSATMIAQWLWGWYTHGF